MERKPSTLDSLISSIKQGAAKTVLFSLKKYQRSVDTSKNYLSREKTSFAGRTVAKMYLSMLDREERIEHSWIYFNRIHSKEYAAKTLAYIPAFVTLMGLVEHVAFGFSTEETFSNAVLRSLSMVPIIDALDSGLESGKSLVDKNIVKKKELTETLAGDNLAAGGIVALGKSGFSLALYAVKGTLAGAPMYVASALSGGVAFVSGFTIRPAKRFFYTTMSLEKELEDIGLQPYTFLADVDTKKYALRAALSFVGLMNLGIYAAPSSQLTYFDEKPLNVVDELLDTENSISVDSINYDLPGKIKLLPFPVKE